MLLAQTQEIQREVETRLWIERVYESLGVAGLPPWVVLLTLLSALLAIVAAVWLWRGRRKAG